MLQKLIFNLWYFFHPPWDTGITPPELMAYIQDNSPGRALDLGCGTGTNAITLAKNDWKVIGVDFASRAIDIARRKAQHAGVNVDFYVDEVTDLRSISGFFDLIIDIGCFHSIKPEDRLYYLSNLERLLESGGTYMLYAFLKNHPGAEGSGIDEEEIMKLTQQFLLIDRKDGRERDIRSSTWIILRKKTENDLFWE
jgi:ubiquinone/menaquinone biosynthesis C-methylase UbiE